MSRRAHPSNISAPLSGWSGSSFPRGGNKQFLESAKPEVVFKPINGSVTDNLNMLAYIFMAR